MPESFLIGQGPKTEFSNYSTLDGTQQSTLDQLLQTLGTNNVGTAGTVASPSYTAPLTAQITAPQQTSLNSIGQLVQALGGGAGASTTAGLTTGTNALTQVANSTPANFQSYFQNSVAQPLMQQFSQQTIPALQAAFGGSAGGTHGSDYGNAVAQATNNLNNTLASDLSSTALSEYNTNQSNKITAGTDLAANSTIPITATEGALTSQALPQTTQQATYSNAYQEFLNQLSQNNTVNSEVLGGATASTEQQNAIAQSGYNGILQDLVQAAGGAVAGKLA